MDSPVAIGRGVCIYASAPRRAAFALRRGRCTSAAVPADVSATSTAAPGTAAASWRVQGAGVAPDIAERRLAHTINGVRGVYDRHAYHDEKTQAFEALAGLVNRIVNPVDNIFPTRA
jgi:hypothetical protein